MIEIQGWDSNTLVSEPMPGWFTTTMTNSDSTVSPAKNPGMSLTAKTGHPQ